MKKRLFVFMLIVLTAGLSFAGGNNEASVQEASGLVTLTMLEVPEQMFDGFKAVISAWEEKTGNIMDVQTIPGDQIKAILNSRINAGEGPDIFMSEGKADQFVLGVDIVEPLNDRTWFKEVPEGTKKLITYTDGTAAYIPVVPLNASGVSYNKKIFEELELSEPKNRKEFLEICETVKNAGYTPLIMQGAPGHEWGLAFWTHQGLSYYDKYYAPADHWEKMNTNKLKYADIDFYEMYLQQMVEYIELGYTNDDILSTTFEMTQSRFANGETAMVVVAEWIVGLVRAINPDFEFGFFPLPIEDDREGVLASFVGTGISVWKDSKNKEVALDFIDFMASKKMQELFYGITPGTPIFPYADVELTPVGRVISENGARGNAMPRFPMVDIIYLHTDWTKGLQSLVNQSKTPNEVLAAYDSVRISAGQQRELPGF